MKIRILSLSFIKLKRENPSIDNGETATTTQEHASVAHNDIVVDLLPNEGEQVDGVDQERNKTTTASVITPRPVEGTLSSTKDPNSEFSPTFHQSTSNTTSSTTTAMRTHHPTMVTTIAKNSNKMETPRFMSRQQQSPRNQ
jgi:hypothetical protein